VAVAVGKCVSALAHVPGEIIIQGNSGDMLTLQGHFYGLHPEEIPSSKKRIISFHLTFASMMS
jgi:hypothetical protein